jgi:hypothetical protein
VLAPRGLQSQEPQGLRPQASPVSLPPLALVLAPRGLQSQEPQGLQPQASPVSLPPQALALAPRGLQSQASPVWLPPLGLPLESLESSPLRGTPVLPQRPPHRDRPVKYRQRHN